MCGDLELKYQEANSDIQKQRQEKEQLQQRLTKVEQESNELREKVGGKLRGVAVDQLQKEVTQLKG